MSQLGGRSSLSAAVASGDKWAVEKLVKEEGVDINSCSPEGFAPLCVAAFWGYADIVKLLLEQGVDVNITNKGTGWTACHCAAFQGHGKVLLHLTQHNPDTTIKDSMGRTSVDFASATDSVWPFFATMGSKRTPKADLIRMDIVKKVAVVSQEGVEADHSLEKMRELTAHFSRPGSAYVLQSQALQGGRQTTQSSVAALAYGDVLRSREEGHLMAYPAAAKNMIGTGNSSSQKNT